MEPLNWDGRGRVTAGEVFVGVVVVGVLYFAREVLVPIALAVLLSFVLTPPLVRLRRWGLGKVPSVLLVVVLGVFVTASVAGVIGVQITHLAGELPKYQWTLQEKIRSLRAATAGGSMVRSLGELLNGISSEISEPASPPPGEAASPASANNPAQTPLPVVVRPPETRPFEIIRTILGPLIQPLATLGLVLIFVIFILLQQQDLRDRLIWLAGSRDLRRTTMAIDDAADRLSHFFLAETAINSSFGVLIGLGLWLIGIPNPMLWGILAMLMRFVPYIGWIISAILPCLLAAAVDPGWTQLAWSVGLFLALELTISQAVEPFVYGRSTGLSPVAVVVAATFWTWLWGPIGLVLSTPLTLLIVVVGQHVERLAFLAVMFGDTPALTPAETFLQRILAGDADEAAEQGERFLKEKPLVSFYDEVVLPALRSAQIEANRGNIDTEDLRRMAITVEEVVENFDDEEDPVRSIAAENGGARKPGAKKEGSTDCPTEPKRDGLKPEWQGEMPVLCIAGRSPLDEAAAVMFRQLLGKQGINVRVASFGRASSAQVFKLEVEGVAMICLSYLAVEGAPTHTRFLIRRLRRRAPSTRILAGFWTYSDDLVPLEDLRKETGADVAAHSLREAVELCAHEAGAAERDGASPAVVPERVSA
ncbi:MAG: AI-2E family transporter [Methylobacteriaceae bacterium]|nr:AI-2E family transporter [Methylobacteriaceae bacterium]MBV9637616.1 AI-2E family transporter [Methylobacteriaceae bacterium]